MHDSSVVRHGGGEHSLRLTAPKAGAGHRAWSYPVKADMLVGEEYILSIWAKGGGEGQTLAVGFEALFGEAQAPCPSGTVGQCSYTPQTIPLVSHEWRHHQLIAKCRFQPDQSGYYGSAGMISVELVSRGTAWVDDVVLTLKNNTAIKV